MSTLVTCHLRTKSVLEPDSSAKPNAITRLYYLQSLGPELQARLDLWLWLRVHGHGQNFCSEMTFQNQNKGFGPTLTTPIRNQHWQPRIVRSKFWSTSDHVDMVGTYVQRAGYDQGSNLGHWITSIMALNSTEFGAWLAWKNSRPQSRGCRPCTTLTGLFTRHRRTQADINSLLEGP